MNREQATFIQFQTAIRLLDPARYYDFLRITNEDDESEVALNVLLKMLSAEELLTLGNLVHNIITSIEHADEQAYLAYERQCQIADAAADRFCDPDYQGQLAEEAWNREMAELCDSALREMGVATDAKH